MDREVVRTLAELERKLHELEQALVGASEGQVPHRPGQTAPAPEQGGVRLVDEGVAAQAPPGHRQPAAGGHAAEQPSAPGWQPPGPGHAAAGAPAPGWQQAPGYGRAPAEPSAPGWQAPDSGPAPAAASAPSWQPAGPAERPSEETIDLAQLTRFRDRLEQTMRELIADYDRIISLRRAPAAPERPGSGPH